MRVLFITNTQRVQRPYLDPAARYRCFNPAEDMRDRGWIVDVVALSRFRFEMIGCYDIFIFHKPGYNKQLEAIIALLEKANKKFLADYDDLIFDKKNALGSSVYLTGRLDKKAAIDVFDRNHKALKLFNHVIVSTIPLGEQVKLSNENAQVFIIHNGLNSRWVESSKLYLKVKPIIGQISYFSGTKSHDHDFQLVEDVLVDVLRKNKNATLEVVGPLDFSIEKFTKSKLSRVKAVPYEDLPAYISKSWVNIAPLESNIFNNCKSGLKFFEAAVFGVPTVATPINDMKRFSTDGILTPSSSEDWKEMLSMVLDPSERFRISQIAYDYAMDCCMSNVQTSKMMDCLENGL